MDSRSFSEFLSNLPRITEETMALLQETDFRSSGDYIGEIRRLATKVEETTQQEFPGHKMAELGRKVRSAVHNSPYSSDAIEAIEILLNQLTSRVGKIRGDNSFKITLVLYTLLGMTRTNKAPDIERFANTTLASLMGQGTLVGDEQQAFIDIWNRMFLNSGISIKSWEVEQAVATAKRVSMNYALDDVGEFLNDVNEVCGYVVSNILPDASEASNLSSGEDVHALLLGQIAAWYFLSYGDPLTADHVRDKLRSRGAPYRYDRYLGHFLMQYALFGTLALTSGDYGWLSAQNTGLRAEAIRIFHEYMVTIAFWDSAIGWDEYVEGIISARFHGNVSSVLVTFEHQFELKHGLSGPEKLLNDIHDYIFGDASNP